MTDTPKVVADFEKAVRAKTNWPEAPQEAAAYIRARANLVTALKGTVPSLPFQRTPSRPTVTEPLPPGHYNATIVGVRKVRNKPLKRITFQIEGHPDSIKFDLREEPSDD